MASYGSRTPNNSPTARASALAIRPAVSLSATVFSSAAIRFSCASFFAASEAFAFACAELRIGPEFRPKALRRKDIRDELAELKNAVEYRLRSFRPWERNWEEIDADDKNHARGLWSSEPEFAWSAACEAGQIAALLVGRVLSQTERRSLRAEIERAADHLRQGHYRRFDLCRLARDREIGRRVLRQFERNRSAGTV
jgi:hypothetical protein